MFLSPTFLRRFRHLSPNQPEKSFPFSTQPASAKGFTTFEKSVETRSREKRGGWLGRGAWRKRKERGNSAGKFSFSRMHTYVLSSQFRDFIAI